MDDIVLRISRRLERTLPVVDTLEVLAVEAAEIIEQYRADTARDERVNNELRAERDAALKTIEVLEANARIQAALLANTGRERDALKLALTSRVTDADRK